MAIRYARALSFCWLFATTTVLAQDFPAPTLASPPDGAADQPTTLTLNWNATTGATAYRLQVSTDVAFTTTVFDDSTLTTTSQQVGPLANTTPYYWHVRATYVTTTSDWSSTWSFTTVPASPTAPTLASPADGAADQPTTLTLSWSATPGATSYHLQVSTSAAFTTIVVEDSTLTGTARQVGPLANNTTYYWRVNAQNTGGTSPWSSIWRFTTMPAPPAAPTLASPPDGAANQPTTLTLSWSATPGATSYHLQVSTSAAFTTIVVEDSTLTGTARQVGPLANDTTYYWRVNAQNTGGTSPWSSIWNFTTVAGAPTATTDPATDVDATSATLNGTVNPKGQSTDAKFQYGTTTNYGNAGTAIQSPVNGTTPVQVSNNLRGLSPNTTYHYRVAAINSSGTVYGQDQTYTTAGLPAATTDPATDVDATSATLNGTVNPNGLNTTAIFQYGTTTSYGSEVTAIPNSMNGSSPVAVRGHISGLTPSTIYHYRVVAMNSAGTTYGADRSFMTNSAQPFPAPTLSAPSDGATNQPTTVTLSWDPTPGATSYRLQVATSADFATPVFEDSTITSPSRQVGPLANNTTYYWHVQTTYVTTPSPWSSTWQFTTVPAPPIVTTDPAMNVTDSSATLNGTVNPNGASTTVTFQYGTTTSYGTEVTATPSPVTGTSPVAVSTQITNLTPNTTYHYRVVAASSGGITYGEDRTLTTASPPYPSTYHLRTSVLFPSYAKDAAAKSTDYRLVGLPGASNLQVDALLSGAHTTDWQVFWDNGTATDYLVKFDGGADFRFSVGRAFWLIKKGPWTVDTEVPSAPLNASQEAEIQVHPGWNLITDPFTSSIPWATVQSVNGVSEPIYSYNGSFTISASFDPYVGYYFFNATNLSVLRIPHISPSSSTLASNSVSPVSWKVNIVVSSGALVDRVCWFGVSRKASESLDPFDIHKPRTIALLPVVYFHHPDWDADHSAFATDIRPEFEDVRRWDFEVHSSKREAFQLTFSGLESIPARFEVYLIDENRAKSLKLRKEPLYSTMPTAETSKFSVLVGKQEIVQEQLRTILQPREFFLGANYPNPFNPSTTIPVAIPMRSAVTLTVYNILGQAVKTIYTGTLNAGRYSFSWDGKNDRMANVASGVYLYRFTTSTGATFTRRMVLLK